MKNKSETEYSALDFPKTVTSASGKVSNMKISSWNVSGVRAWLKVGILLDKIEWEKLKTVVGSAVTLKN